MAPALLLATDFDGTIATIVPRPEDAVIHPAAALVLQQCAATPSIAVAVLSGRDVDDVRGRLGGLRAIVAGSHGLECRGADGEILWTADRELPPRELEVAPLRLERKKYSYAVHYRGIDPPAERLEAFEAWARAKDLEVVRGRQVVEARLRGGGKGEALRRIAEMSGAPRVVFAGDDITDFEALAYAARHGVAIFVESEERQAPAVEGMRRVRTLEELADLFGREAVDAAGSTIPV
ncbi:MAG TPA: trehalose-phosphatase [Thermoanaerobaculia bacterium]|nr:trehalose-phosphatase [Thermoanaerobaculia bacterium]